MLRRFKAMSGRRGDVGGWGKIRNVSVIGVLTVRQSNLCTVCAFSCSLSLQDLTKERRGMAETGLQEVWGLGMDDQEAHGSYFTSEPW